MKTISDKAIDRAWKHINDVTPEDGQLLLQEMTREQPYIVGYLLCAEETLMAEEERGDLIMMGLVVWKALSDGHPPLRLVTETDLEEADAANMKFFEQLEAGSEMDYLDGVQSMLSTYNQMPLLASVLETLMAGSEDEPELAPENIGQTLLHMKTVVDCLDQ